MATIELNVVVSPRAGKDEVVGWKEDAAGRSELSVRVTAPPEGGRATKQVCKVVASSLGIAKGNVSCKRGATSRHKQLAVECDRDVFDRWSASL